MQTILSFVFWTKMPNYSFHKKQLQSGHLWLVGLPAPSLSWETLILIDNCDKSLLIFQQILICCFQVHCHIKIFCAILFISFLKIKRQSSSPALLVSINLFHSEILPLCIYSMSTQNFFYHKISQLCLHLCILCIVSVPFFAVEFTGDHP